MASLSPRTRRRVSNGACKPLTDDVVRAAIRDSLQLPDARIDVLAISRTQAPAGKVSFPIAGLLASTLTRSRHAGHLARRSALSRLAQVLGLGPREGIRHHDARGGHAVDPAGPERRAGAGEDRNLR